jgi:hypothetical protein
MKPETLYCSDCGELLHRFSANSEFDGHICLNWHCQLYRRPGNYVRIKNPRNKYQVDETFYNLTLGEKFESE